MVGNRIGRERDTIEKMINIYCQNKHGQKRCSECEELFNYAMQRLERCKFGENKPVCAKCPIHCYRADMRTRVKDVMRFSGPKMLLRHPYLAIIHLIDSFTRNPA